MYTEAWDLLAAQKIPFCLYFFSLLFITLFNKIQGKHSELSCCIFIVSNNKASTSQGTCSLHDEGFPKSTPSAKEETSGSSLLW